ncbi:MAG: hypothetical protein H7Z41_06965 [Cytophagales bacterium]|nr:hypothetical protein [Armatimonadota bacterium]
MITFATFHMALPEDLRTTLSRDARSFRVRDDASHWIALLFRSARHFHPDCRCVCLSDEMTPLDLPAPIEICRRPARSNDPLWSRLQAERDFLQEAGHHSGNAAAHILFLDSDVLINGLLEPAFAESFDVALPNRPHPEMPINAGVPPVKTDHHDAAIRFFDTVLTVFDERFHQDLWWGDPLALAAILGNVFSRDSPPQQVAVQLHAGARPKSV